jgi:subtilisin-like proprotein convertase family protein
VPESTFASFAGTSPNGTWTLRVADDAGGDTGTLNRWSMLFCTTS